MTDETTHSPYDLDFQSLAGDTLQLKLAGDWRTRHCLPDIRNFQQRLDSQGAVRKLSFDSSALTDWDSAVLVFLLRVKTVAEQKQLEIDASGLPEGVQRLIELASAVPERKGARRTKSRTPFLARIGNNATSYYHASLDALEFLGQVTQSLMRLLRGKAQFRWSDLALIIQQTGSQALGIVALISFLVGVILAYIGAAQLAAFGATVYTADLVGIGMARAMGAMMTGIIMAGRTGAAFAAQLGTMQVNEEIDALDTLGISSIDFLVLPRMLALILMMPLLTLYSVLFGMLGGLFVSVLALDIGITEYVHRTVTSVHLRHFGVGLVEGTVYGILVAIAGCYQGIKCGRSSSAVGAAATRAVVSSILLIVIATAILTVIFNVLGI